MEENVRALSDIPAINRFLSYCRVRTVPSKTVLIHAGDLPDVLYYVISGSVEVMIEDEEGNEMVLAYLNKGQFFGEMGLFYEQPTRSAWVRTRSACELAEMTYPRFRQVATESPGLIFELATQLATRLDRTNRKLGDLAFVDVTGRVAHAIMDLCGEPDAMTHPEGMQIKDAKLGGIFNMGGAAVANYVSILEPVKLSVDPELKGRKRRLAAGAALAMLVVYRLAMESGPAIGTLAGAALILPFFLFSALAGQYADKHDKADLCEDVDVEFCHDYARDRAQEAHGHDENHRQRQRPAFVLRRQHQEHQHHGQQKHQHGGVAR